MADETFVGRSIPKIIIKGDLNLVREYQTNGADIKPGDVVTTFGETANTRDIDLAGASETVTGIVSKGTAGFDPSTGLARNLDAALDDNEAADVMPVGSGLTGWATYQTGGATIKEGQPLIVGSEAGKLAPLGAYVDSVEATDFPIYVVCRAAQDVTTDGSDDQKIKVVMRGL